MNLETEEYLDYIENNPITVREDDLKRLGSILTKPVITIGDLDVWRMSVPLESLLEFIPIPEVYAPIEIDVSLIARTFTVHDGYYTLNKDTAYIKVTEIIRDAILPDEDAQASEEIEYPFDQLDQGAVESLMSDYIKPDRVNVYELTELKELLEREFVTIDELNQWRTNLHYRIDEKKGPMSPLELGSSIINRELIDGLHIIVKTRLEETLDRPINQAIYKVVKNILIQAIETARINDLQFQESLPCEAGVNADSTPEVCMPDPLIETEEDNEVKRKVNLPLLCTAIFFLTLVVIGGVHYFVNEYNDKHAPVFYIG